MQFPLPQQWDGLCALVFVLGLRHGFDADHLATIDGFTRLHSRKSPVLARLCGALFSLGHGLVVLAIALGSSALAAGAGTPRWLDAFGAWISIGFLVALGLANLHAVFSAPAHEVVAPVGLRARLLGPLGRFAGGWGIVLTGALFALSFDTVSQALLFTAAAGRFGGLGRAAALAGCFVVGMLATDGLNGIWISTLLRRADQTARVLSRAMGLTVASLSLAVAAYGVACLTAPGVAAWAQRNGEAETMFGALVIAIVAGSFLLVRRFAPPAPAGIAVVAGGREPR